MTREIVKWIGVQALVAVMAAAPAMAQEAAMGWDADGDSALTVEEFVAGFAERGVFDKWDEDGDGELSGDEFTQGAYRTYDQDLSGELSELEYNLEDDDPDPVGAARFWKNREAAMEGDAWDIDGDGVILSNEFASGFGQAGILEAWDTDGDGGLSEEEFAAGIFDRYDEDGNGVIEDPELGDIGDDMGDEGFWDW